MSEKDLTTKVANQLTAYCTKCPMGCTKLREFEACPFWGGIAYLELKNARNLSEGTISTQLTQTHKEIAGIAHDVVCRNGGF